MRKAIEVRASPAEVWKVWTTKEGLQSFLAPQVRIDLEVGGAFEPLFELDKPPGSQGGEGLQILSYVPHEMISFTWSAPPEFLTIRSHYHTWVVVRFRTVTPERTRVSLDQMGWGTGEKWDRVFAFFDRAWDVVLARLAHRFETGPVNWQNPFQPSREFSASVHD